MRIGAEVSNVNDIDVEDVQLSTQLGIDFLFLGEDLLFSLQKCSPFLYRVVHDKGKRDQHKRSKDGEEYLPHLELMFAIRDSNFFGLHAKSLRELRETPNDVYAVCISPRRQPLALR